MSDYSSIKHLSREDIIKNGSIFTPKKLTELVHRMCERIYAPDMVVMDLCSGYGAFISEFHEGTKIVGTEIDDVSYSFLRQEFPDVCFFHENSLLNIGRERYGLTDERLLIVGNPPYNDVTSQYRKGEKGKLECDADVVSRDFGISFLKAYNKLQADFVCVLHPLAYLIKKQNFNSLGVFKDNYRLEDATIFSSKEFETIQKASSDFPVVAAFYRRGESMDFDYIRRFEFKILDSEKNFMLGDIQTIDGIVPKYPSANKEGLLFYTLRDMNALIRNAGFVKAGTKNGIPVSLESLYKYSWLLFLKNNFKPRELKFVYGNLSPLYSPRIEEEEFKKRVVSYAYENCELVRNAFPRSIIEEQYGFSSDYVPLYNLLNALYL